MKLFYRRKGFTLLELMIVVIVIGILASLAIPRFISARDKAIKAEAMNVLGMIRASQYRYYLENNPPAYSTTTGALDLDVPSDSDYFTYGAANNSAGSKYIGAASGIGGTVMDGVYLWIGEDPGPIQEGGALP